MIIQIMILLLGFVLLVKGADWFVEGAASIARKLGIPQLIVGLTDCCPWEPVCRKQLSVLRQL